MSGGISFVIDFDSGSPTYVEAFNSAGGVVARAATQAMADAGAILKDRARADIAAAGFSQKWQQALRVKSYPDPGKPALDPAVYLAHKIPYSEVFESGALIRGKPLLWLPLSRTPMRQGRQMPVKQYLQGGGHLYPVRGRTPPLLVGTVRPGGTGRKVPLYVGLDAVSIRKRFHIPQITQEVATLIPSLYASHL